MTKNDWDQVKTSLERFWGSAELKIDGYQISLSLVRVSTYKLAIAIYVNGVFKGEWLMKECEERRRFFPKKERSLLTAKDKASWKKFSKKTRQELETKYDKKYEFYASHWTSFGSLKKHLIDNNTSIELVSIR